MSKKGIQQKPKKVDYEGPGKDYGKGPWIYFVRVPTFDVHYEDITPLEHECQGRSCYFNLVVDYSKDGPARPRPGKYINFLDVRGEPRALHLHTREILRTTEIGEVFDDEVKWRKARLKLIYRWRDHWECELIKEKENLLKVKHNLVSASKRPKTKLKHRYQIPLEFYVKEVVDSEERITKIRYALEKLYSWADKLKRGDPVPRIGSNDELIG